MRTTLPLICALAAAPFAVCDAAWQIPANSLASPPACKPGVFYALGKGEGALIISLRQVEYRAARVKAGPYERWPAGGKKLAVVRFSVRNPLAEEQHFSHAIKWTATARGGVNAAATEAFNEEPPHESVNQTLEPGQQIDAYTIIEVPAAGELLRLTAVNTRNGVAARYPMAGIGRKIAPPYADPADASGATALQTIPGRFGQTYEIGDVDIAVLGIQISTASSAALDGLSPDKAYALVKFRVRNKSTEGLPIHGFHAGWLNATLLDPDGSAYRAVSGAMRPTALDTFSPSPEYDETVEFRLPFLVPRNRKLSALRLGDRSTRLVTFRLDSAAAKLPAAPAVSVPSGSKPAIVQSPVKPTVPVTRPPITAAPTKPGETVPPAAPGGGSGGAARPGDGHPTEPAPPPAPASRMTNFKPDTHGFHFRNTFSNDFVPQLDYRTGGLCGGMSYAALDYYYAGVPVPNQDYRPANKTTLQQYLYNRQVTSIVSPLPKWMELGFNPGGARNTEFFNWGLQAGPGGRITELRSFIDQGKPVPLGLQGAGSGSHQVVAVGYDMGRYAGDLGPYKEDLRIFIYDPNYPGKMMTLIPRLSDQTYTLAGEEKYWSWRSYFVNTGYTPETPPNLPNPNYPADGKIRELLLEFRTGNDDLRGGNDNVNLVVTLKTPPNLSFTNVNLGSRWLSNYEETARIVLPSPIAVSQLNSVILQTTFGGGVAGDNWDMARLNVVGIGGGGLRQEVAASGYKRFTGSDRTLLVPIQPGPVVLPGYVDRLEVSVETGDDDLRGGNDNLDIVVFATNLGRQGFLNVNGSGRWANGSTYIETLRLSKPVRPQDITQVTLATTFGGGIGGDNWNMKSLTLYARGNGVYVKIGEHGFKRFTGSDRAIDILTRPMP